MGRNGKEGWAGAAGGGLGGELMGDLRKKREELTAHWCWAARETRAGGVGGTPWGASRRFLSLEKFHKPSSEYCTALGASLGVDWMALQGLRPQGVRLRLIRLGCLRRLGSGCV